MAKFDLKGLLYSPEVLGGLGLLGAGLQGKSPSADHHDYKSKLQEIVQENQGAMPRYRIIREEGPDHEKTFWIELAVYDIETQGSGKSKKMAEQDAARRALEILNQESQ